jgi:hypothetical protein
MTLKFVRAPKTPVLIAAGMALLLLATVGAGMVATSANPYRLPVVIRASGAIHDAIFGIALLFVALRRSPFAGATAVIVATFIAFNVVLNRATSLVFGLSDRVTWWTAVYLAIAASVIGSSLFPWSRTANKPAFILMGLTFATLTLLMVSLAVLARL